ncbi:MAG TPA: DUF5666 domain-containing protein [Vicinamibacterales bacterium]
MVAPQSVSVPALGGSAEIRVTAAAGCRWTATSSTSWLDVRGGSGAGTGTFRIQVALHVGLQPRSGSVTVEGQSITVEQQGALPGPQTLTGTVSGLSGSCPNLTFSVAGQTIRTNVLTGFPRNGCPRMSNGAEVEVRGLPQLDGSLLATRVDVADDDADDDGVGGGDQP